MRRRPNTSNASPRQLQFNLHLFTYGALHIYAIAGAMMIGAALGLVSIKSSILHYLADPSRMAAMYMAGRLVTTAAFVGCGLMLLRLGRLRLGSLAVGAFGAAIFLMTPAAVVQAHVLKNHMFWAFLALCTLDRSLVLLRSGTLKDYAWAGICAGLTMASFLGSWTACLVVAAAGTMRLAGLGGPGVAPPRLRSELQGLLLSGACAAAVFLLVNPYWILDCAEAMQELAWLRNFAVFDLSHPRLFAANALRRSITDPVLTLMFAGVAFGLIRGRRDPALLLCAVAFLMGLVAMATVPGYSAARQARYFLGWVAVGSLLAGRLLSELCALKGLAGRFATAAAVVTLAGLGCQGLTYAHNFHLGEGATSNHFLAGEWIERNVPKGEVIGLLRYPQPSNSPFFRFDRYRLKFIEPKLAPGLPPEKLPRWLALTIPDYDDRPELSAVLARYDKRASFPRGKLFPWIEIDPSSTTANPLIEVYRLREKGA